MAPSLERTKSSSKKTTLKQAASTAGSATPPAPARQSSISQLLKSQESKRASEEPQDSPSSKKRKLFSHNNHSTIQQPAQPVSKASMWNFGSTRSNGGGVAIDISSSPISSPNHRSRRVSVTARVDTSNTNGAPKKIIVKNLRAGPRTSPDQYVSKTFASLEDALSAVFGNKQPQLSNEELYRGSENLCKLGKARELWKVVQERCRQHVAQDFRAPLLARASEDNIAVLTAVLEAWSTWKAQLLIIRGIFFYLDRAYLLHERQPMLYETAINQFRDEVFNDQSLKQNIIDGTYELLLADRRGESPDQTKFSEAVKMFHDLQVYSSFEASMLARSQEYIMTWADKECAERELPEYVAEAVRFMSSEVQRCEQFDLDMSTRRDLLTLLEDHIIERKEAELTNVDSVQDILDKDEEASISQLEQLYALLQRRRLGNKLKPGFAAWIDLTGTDIIFDDKQQEQMVIRLLALKQKLDNVWHASFHKDQELGHALRESFETFINKTKKSSGTHGTGNSKPGEMIAKYLDVLMKAGAKAIPAALSTATTTSKPAASAVAPAAERDEEGDDEDAVDEDTEVNKQLDAVLDLFRFVHGKAVFEAFYKRDLARRLLMGRSASNDAEKNMLARLKTECGSGFTQNLEQMFKDIELDRDEMNAYKQRFENNDRKANIDLNVNILSASAWPSYPDVPVNVPVEIKKTIDDFESHYNQKHSGRKLQWKHALAHCQLKADFPKGRKELVVSSFQAIVLLLFNGKKEDEQVSYDYIKSETGLSDPEVQRTLQSLACAKLRPLTKHPKSRDVNPTDTFTLNTSFSHPKYRVKINAIQLKETKEENKETHVRVAADRQFETQAAIVRIMKQRKHITHAELVAEVIAATRTRGTMDVGDIKKNIDKLIEKEYMERAEGNTYEYLA